MGQPHCIPSREQVVDTMIGLTRLSNQHRAIVAGSDSMDLYLALRRRGLVRVATTATCRVPRGQHAVGLITGQTSLAAIEAALFQVPRVAKARSLPEEAVRQLVVANTQGRLAGLLGEPRVNVLALNLAVDRAASK